MGNLGTNLKNARLKKGLTQKQLAEMIEAKHNSISNWENNQNKPDPDTLELLCGVLDVSVDYLLYGFDRANFTSLLNLVRYRRSIKELSEDTGIDEIYLNRLCSGVEYKQPSIDTVLKIAIHNENDFLVGAESLVKAAGYDLEEMSGDLLEDIPLELLHHYQKQGMTETEMAISYTKFREAESKDAMAEPNNIEESIKHEPKTIAAHHEGDEWTEEELAEIERFKEFIRSKKNSEVK